MWAVIDLELSQFNEGEHDLGSQLKINRGTEMGQHR